MVFTASNSSSTYAYNLRADHHALSIEIEKVRTSGSSSKKLVQTKIDSNTIAIPKQERVVAAALEWIIEDQQPFTAMDSPKHRALLNLFNPKVNVPCAATIRAGMINHCRTLTGRLKFLMGTTLLYGTLTADGWTSGSGKPFLSITLHWLDDNFKHHEYLLDLAPQPYPHTHQRTARLLHK